MIDSITVEHQWLDLASGTVPESVLPASPFQLVTLWDMLRFEAHWFYRAAGFVDLRCSQFSHATTAKGRHKDDHPTDTEIKDVEIALDWMEPHCVLAQLKRSEECIRDIRLDIEHKDTYVYLSLESMYRRLIALKVALSRDLEEHLFMYFPSGQVKYYQQEKLFGPEVFESFPGASHDVTEAGNCYALERYTACVFHCMRVLEKGLHALVRDLNANHSANIVFNKEIESVNWGNIIEKTEAEIRRLIAPNAQPRMPHDDLQFFSQTVIEFVYFKSAWRDDVSHSRSNYDDTEALTVLNHVEAFMRKIAAKLTE